MRLPSPSMMIALAGLVAAAGQAVVGRDEVTSTSVKDHSLVLADFGASALERLRGPAGPPGARGRDEAGRGQVHRKSTTVPVPVGATGPCPMPTRGFRLTCAIPRYTDVTATLDCDAGQVAVGGGATPDDAQVVDVRGSYPTPAGTGWTAIVENSDLTRPHGFTIHVLCVRGTAMTFG